MRPLIGIALLIVLAVVATSPRFLRLRRATLVGALVSGGWLGVGAGALIGPDALGIVAPGDAARAAPILTIGLGWVGLMIGLQLRADILRQVPRAVYQMQLADAGLTLVVIGGGAAMIARFVLGFDPAQALLVAAVLAASGLGWAAETRSLRLGASAPPELVLALRAGAGLSAPIAVTFFGVVVAMAQPGAGLITAGLRIVALGAVAAALGLVARFSLRRAGDSRPDFLAILLGVVALITGAAVELRVSPLLASMMAGVVIANLAGAELRKFERVILEAEHVVAVLYAIVAGALLDLNVSSGYLALAGAIIGLRVAFKPWVLGASSNGRAAIGPARLALLRQSPVALMLGVELTLTDSCPDPGRLLAAIALTGLVCDLVALIAGWSLSPATRTADDPPPEDGP